MPRPQPDPDQVAFAKKRVKEGASVRDISKEFAEMGFKVLPMTVSRWSRQGEPAAPIVPTPEQHRAAFGCAPHPAPPAAKPSPLGAALAKKQAASPPAPVLDTSDTLGTLRGLLESFMGEAHRSREGNPRLATTLAKSAADVLDQIRKIEAGQKEDSDFVKIPRKELEAAMVSLITRVINPLRARQGLPAIEL